MDSEKLKLIHEVGSVLALLAEKNGGIFIQNLLKDYQSETGKVFPLRKMGYINPVKAIKAMGEHVKIIGDKSFGVKRILSLDQDETILPSNQNQNRAPLRSIQPPNHHFQLPNFSQPPPLKTNIPPPMIGNSGLSPMDPSRPPPPITYSNLAPNIQSRPPSRGPTPPSYRSENMQTRHYRAPISPEPDTDEKMANLQNGNQTPSDPETEIKGEKAKKKKRAKKSLMIPQRMTYQLTFVNQYQLEKIEIVDVFAKFGELVRVSVFSGIKRRCFIHYKNEENAIAALEALKDDDQYFDLEIADACKREPSESDNEEESSEEEEETNKKPIDMVIHRGAYQLSYSTENYVHKEEIGNYFAEHGSNIPIRVAGVDSNFRRVKGRARVFVKFYDKATALTVLNKLGPQFEDLEIAKSCVVPEVDPKLKSIVPLGPDDFYCLRFRNFGPGNGLFATWQIYDMFNQFGEVASVRQDTMQWCYIRYSRQEEAQAAFDEYSSYNTILDSFGIANTKSKDDQDADIEDDEQTDMELFISNYPHAMTLKNLRRIFKDHKLKFRRTRVTEQKAYCFAKVGTVEEMKAVIRDLNGLDIRGRRLIVRAKIQEMHEAIEEELRAEAEQTKDQEVNGWGDRYQDLEETEVKVIIAGYSEDTTEDDLWQLLAPYRPTKILMGEPEEAEEESFTFSNIFFANKNSATRAIEELDGTTFGSSEIVLEIDSVSNL